MYTDARVLMLEVSTGYLVLAVWLSTICHLQATLHPTLLSVWQECLEHPTRDAKAHSKGDRVHLFFHWTLLVLCPVCSTSLGDTCFMYTWSHHYSVLETGNRVSHGSFLVHPPGWWSGCASYWHPVMPHGNQLSPFCASQGSAVESPRQPAPAMIRVLLRRCMEAAPPAPSMLGLSHIYGLPSAAAALLFLRLLVTKENAACCEERGWPIACNRISLSRVFVIPLSVALAAVTEASKMRCPGVLTYPSHVSTTMQTPSPTMQSTQAYSLHQRRCLSSVSLFGASVHSIHFSHADKPSFQNMKDFRSI